MSEITTERSGGLSRFLPRSLPGFWTTSVILLVAATVVLSVMRWAGGLGAVTNLSDAYPWGIWKALNVLGGVAMGAAGFTIMGTVYVFHAKRFEPLVKPAVLMALLAYTTAGASLFVDIGRSWAIWHPIVMWNPDSILFDVAWCLMLYLSILVLECSGMVFQRIGWHRAAHIQHMVTLPIVIIGILLSTLHQSSLGALFLIVPGKLHPLWYTEWLPGLFYVSAIAMGFAMVIILARLAGRGEPAIPMKTLTHASRVLFAALGVYAVMRIYDLATRHALGYALDTTYEAILFHVEFVVGVLVPGVMLAFPKVRESARGLYVAAVMVMLGFVANRLNVSITGFEWAQGGHYVPTFSEMLISLGIPGAAFLAFRWLARVLQVFPKEGGGWRETG